jgi:7-cyano-7-deazaguanine synthase
MEQPGCLPHSDLVFPPDRKDCLAILVSGGLDSSILLGELLRSGATVFPLYVRQGLFWEDQELHFLQRFLEAGRGPGLQPLTVLEMPVGDVYGDHWSVTGRNVPGPDTSDEAVFLPGRNVLLLAKALLWCHVHQVPAVALAPLEANPFPDATETFFAAYQKVVNEGVAGSVAILRPYARLRKTEVMQRGRDLPLSLTFSCIRPAGLRHCGNCNKCAERQRAFAAAGVPDPTEYHVQPAPSRGRPV